MVRDVVDVDVDNVGGGGGGVDNGVDVGNIIS